METLSHCPLCKAVLIGVTYLKVRDYLVSDLMFNIEQCTACGFLFTNPRPNELEISKYYQSQNYISHTDNRQSIQDCFYQTIKQLMLRKKLRLLKKHTKNTKGNNLLDYGCGTGDFVLAARKQGYHAIGYEPGTEAKEKARLKGAEVLENENILYSNHTQKFDVVTLWHVLEHLHKLQEKMEGFYKLLKPGALLVIALPMANSADASFYREHWAAFDVPRHLYHFTPKTLELLCSESGFRIIERKGLFFDSFYVSLLSEKHKNKAAAPALSIIRGLSSNIKAACNANPWSSETFVCKKEA